MGHRHLIYNNGTRNSIFIGNQRSFRQFHSLLQAFKEANYDLVGQTIKSALDIENPRGQIILHSDDGDQYRSFDHKEILDQNGITPSMSAPATPGDNACAENFFSIFKTECIYLEKPKTPEQAAQLTEKFIFYYNFERIQSRSGLTPYEERRKWYDANW